MSGHRKRRAHQETAMESMIREIGEPGTEYQRGRKDALEEALAIAQEGKAKGVRYLPLSRDEARVLYYLLADHKQLRHLTEELEELIK